MLPMRRRALQRYDDRHISSGAHLAASLVRQRAARLVHQRVM